jgi:SAM-dependent methyltransferase
VQTLGLRAVYVAHRVRPRTFVVDGRTCRELVWLKIQPGKNPIATWQIPRAIEVPLARSFVERHPGSLLEVGNVLGLYGPRDHIVVDKYDKDPSAVKVDVVEYVPDRTFHAIVTISTLEHIGWDAPEQVDPDKIAVAVRHLRSLLAPGGRLFATCPIGYNPHLDRLISDGSLEPVVESFLHQSHGGDWHEVWKSFALENPTWLRRRDRQSTWFGRGAHWGASTLWIAEFDPTGA